MKTKSFLIWIIAPLFLAISMFGQASFALRNRYAGVDAPVFDAQGVGLRGTNYLVELWGGATADSLNPALNLDNHGERLIIPFQNSSGYFSSDASFLSIVTIPPSGFAWLEVRAWNASLGNTYEAAVAQGLGGYGESPPFYAQGSNPSSDPPQLAAPLIGLQSFSLRPVVPEPSTWALFALGAMAVWLAARRQQSL